MSKSLSNRSELSHCQISEESLMPYKNPKPCKYPGCPGLTSGSYCEMHSAHVKRNYNQHIRPVDTNKIYGRRWHTIRDLYISRHPICEQCLLAGRYVPVDEVHHKLPVDQGGTHSEDNLMALCQSCHTKTRSS